ncbi:hypothetical protein BJ508DRAFT_378353 [Ascobolus immersus RN42]|uniref:Uncharacterized protein n=1 Tax=Ascobolus immersus RN42 TaxID=1160509 RepID=A0A3N4HWX2_ASCIM|nr:hypothetical protein BJ508DRAFT_378353 [Ascobolus immersus RN42]
MTSNDTPKPPKWKQTGQTGRLNLLSGRPRPSEWKAGLDGLGTGHQKEWPGRAREAEDGPDGRPDGRLPTLTHIPPRILINFRVVSDLTQERRVGVCQAQEGICPITIPINLEAQFDWKAEDGRGEVGVFPGGAEEGLGGGAEGGDAEGGGGPGAHALLLHLKAGVPERLPRGTGGDGKNVVLPTRTPTASG